MSTSLIVPCLLNEPNLPAELVGVRNGSATAGFPALRRIAGWLLLLVAVNWGGAHLGAQSVSLAWDACSDPNVAGCTVYWGTASGDYTNSQDAGAQAAITISNLPAGTTCYFAVAAYDAAGDQSPFSAEISYTVPAETLPVGTPFTFSNSLSASWPVSEGSGTTVNDVSGNGNTGTLINSPLWVAGLNGGKALEFSGSYWTGAAYVSVPGSTTLADQGIGSNITICAWVKRSPESVGNYCSVVAKDIPFDVPPYHRNYELIFDTGSHILFVYRNSAGTSWEMYASSTVHTDTSGWHFYCVTYTYGCASSCTLYVDGVPVAGSWIVGNGSDAPASTSGGPVLLGTDGTGTAANGSIYDQIGIYNTTLPASQVTALYNSGYTPALVSTTNGIAGTTNVPTGTTNAVAGTTNALTGTTNAMAGATPLVPSTTTVTSSQNPAVAGSGVTFAATVGGIGGTPTGTVVFYDGTNNLGIGTLSGSGVATASTSALSADGSPYSITAVYSGDSVYTNSTSSVFSEVITNPSPTTSVPITVVNGSFESPAGAQGTVAGVPVGWLASNKDPYGVYNPAVGVYTIEANDILPSPAQGSQVLWINSGNYVAQFFTNTLQAGQTYTLSGAIGNRGDGYGMLPSDQEYVALLAGSTIIAQNTNLTHPAPGTFLSWTISYTTPAAGFPSGPLQIRLGQNGAGEVNFDNIKFAASPANPTVAAAIARAVAPVKTRITPAANSSVLAPNPVISLGGTYHGLFYVPNDAAEESSGAIAVTVTHSRAFSAKLGLGASSYPFSGKFNVTGTARTSIPRPGLRSLAVQLELGSVGGSLTGAICDGTWTACLLADADVPANANPAANTGQYTLLIPGSENSSNQPGGNGFGAVTVSDTGNVTFSGILGDGTPVTAACRLSGQGRWPFYVSLYGGKGSILGWLNFTSEGGISGQTAWFKLPQAAARFYPGGFIQSAGAIGSAYHYTNGLPVLGFTNGSLSLLNGNLAQGITSPISLASETPATDGSASRLSVNTSSGLFQISVISPETGRPISVRGIVLQNQNYGAGLFLGPSETGSALLSP